MYDRQHIGSINPRGTSLLNVDIKQALSGLGPEARNESIYQLAVDLCSEGSGNISFEDFIHLMTPKLLESDTVENIDKLFALFDTSKTGYISIADLRRIAQEMAFECSDEDLQDMIKRADGDLDGLVSKEEFHALMSNGVAQ